MRACRTRMQWILAVFFVCSVTQTEAQEGRIGVYPDNPWYWQYHGGPILLFGGSDADNLFNHPDLLAKNIDTLAEAGGNYIRCTLSGSGNNELQPYMLSDEGRFNLRQFNLAYWDRLDACLREADRRDIVVQLDIWATDDFYADNWLKNPFNPDRNVNYSVENTSLEYSWEYHPAQRTQPFFLTLPALDNDSTVRAYQEAFVRQVLEVAMKYPNVLYSIGTESRAPVAWAQYWADFIRNAGGQRGLTLPVTVMWDQRDITAVEHEATYLNPDTFGFSEVSTNNWQEGQTHFDRLIWYRQRLASLPGGARPMTNVSVPMRRGGGRSASTDVAVDRWWQNIFAGCASTRFGQPDEGIGLNRTALRQIEAARAFISVFGLYSSEPRPDLLSDRGENEAYCLATPGSAYAVYFPAGGRVNLEVYLNDAGYRVRWLDTEDASFTELSERDTFRITRQADNPGRQLIELEPPSGRRVWIAVVELL